MGENLVNNAFILKRLTVKFREGVPKNSPKFSVRLFNYLIDYYLSQINLFYGVTVLGISITVQAALLDSRKQEVNSCLSVCVVKLRHFDHPNLPHLWTCGCKTKSHCVPARTFIIPTEVFIR